LHIYAFGSTCRGEIDLNSDIDLLAIVDNFDDRFDPNIYSIYSYKRISEIWYEGNPFAWHLHTESKLIFAYNNTDYLKTLGAPSEYINCKTDCIKFYNLFIDSYSSIIENYKSYIFDLSTMFLAIRNFSTCYSLGMNKICNFTRNSALNLNEKSLNVSSAVYQSLLESRILSIRGKGVSVDRKFVENNQQDFDMIKNWMNNLLKEVKNA
jgi:hypothetical protein